MRVCVIYDCLTPYTIGGAEWWYRKLAERLSGDGHDVTYLTRLQWDADVRPQVSGVRVVALPPRMGLYTKSGRRRIDQAVVFGIGTLCHLLRYGGRYDVVHTASFPYFSLLAAGVARRVHRYRLMVDWHELWSRAYWREYLGAVGGRVGWVVQALCLRVPQRAFCRSELYARRLREEHVNGPVTVVEGAYEGEGEVDLAPGARCDVVVFAGRHIPEKRAGAIVPAVAVARQRVPGLRALIFGDGPERPAILAAVAQAGIQDAVDVPGFVERERIERCLGTSLAMILPSRREGLGTVVVEAASRGTPSIVVAGPDNASSVLVEDGVNGVVAPSASAEDLAAAIIRVREGGEAMRQTTAKWFHANVDRLSLDRSIDRVAANYQTDSARS
jgi:glycosyltransferase involved in cell wall biosynthesis